MNTKINYKENYEYNIKNNNATNLFHIDYGTRYKKINMDFQHFHNYYEMYILLNGKSNHMIEGQFYPLEELDIVVLQPYQLHKTEYVENHPNRRLIITFTVDYLQSHLLHEDLDILSLFNTATPIFRFSEETTESFIHIYNQIYTHSMSDDRFKNIKIYSLFLELLYQLHANSPYNIYSYENSSNLTGKIYSITHYIHEHYKEDLSLEDLAKKFYISSYYLSHQFKSITGFTLMEYIQMTRVKKVQQMLVETDKTSVSLCEECGFGSLSQYNRIFKKITHMSPSAYRKKNKSL